MNPVPDAEGFTKGIVWRGVVNASQTPQMQAAQNISQVFMGVNLKCASCHDSFINDWQLADAYGLASIYADQPLEMVECDKPTGKTASMKFLYPELGQHRPGGAEGRAARSSCARADRPAERPAPRTIVNRLWARFMGRGLVEPVDDMEQAAWHPDLLDWLAEDLVAHGYDLKQTMTAILTSKRLPARGGEPDSRREPYVFRGPETRRLTAEQFVDAVSAVTGIWQEAPDARVNVALVPSHAVPPRDRTRAGLVAANPLMLALGRPNREQVVTTRTSAATTLQTLELLNGPTLADHLRQRGGALQGQPRERAERSSTTSSARARARATETERRLAVESAWFATDRRGDRGPALERRDAAGVPGGALTMTIASTRRDFLHGQRRHAVGAGAAGFPAAVAGAGAPSSWLPTADTRDRALDGRRHGAHRDVRPEALHAVCAGPAPGSGPQHVPVDRHGRRPHQVLAGARAASPGSWIAAR